MVLIPLIIVGYISFSKSQTALLNLSKNQSIAIAADLARLTRKILESEMTKAASMAISKTGSGAGKPWLNNPGLKAPSGKPVMLSAHWENQFSRMGQHYQGVYITDSMGTIYTGVLENGETYKKIDISKDELFLRVKQNRPNRRKPDENSPRATGKPVVSVGCADQL